MPALSRVRVSALEELAEGQRFTPARTVVRQIERIERLALEIDREGMYPEDWVAQRITGFKPRIEEPRLIVGAALLADLSALAERLSEAARLEDVPAKGLIGIDVLASMWNVSHKTIERYRRDGLIGRRVRDDRSIVRIVFAPSAIDSFARMRGPRVARGSGFSRLIASERARAIRWVAQYRRRLGWSVSQGAARAAVRLGRSPGAVRRALESSRDPALAPRQSLEGREARFVERAMGWGIPVEQIGAHIGRTRASVHRIALAARLARIAPLDHSTPMDDRLTEATAHALIDAPAPQAGLDVDRWETVWAAVAHSRRGIVADGDLERARVGAYHALRWLVRREDAGARNEPARAEAVDRMETRLRWASHLKRSLVAGEIALVVRTIESLTGKDLAGLGPGASGVFVLGGLAIVGAAVDGFDPSRGGRIAGAATLPLTRWLTARIDALGSGAPGHARRRGGAETGSIAGWDRGICPWDGWIREPVFVETGWTGLEGDDRRAVAARFGLAGSRPLEMPAVGEALGCGARRAAILVMRGVVTCRKSTAERGR